MLAILRCISRTSWRPNVAPCHHQTVVTPSPSRRFIQTAPSRALPKPPALSELITEKDNAEATAWVNQFTGSNTKITRDLVELTFSRSSGPGGQNVNKVNTKATLRCSLSAFWIPKWAAPALMKNPHYVTSTNSILITSSTQRSQAQNVDECLQKLHGIVLSAASGAIKKAPSAEQKKRVEGFMKAAKEARKTEKTKRSTVKQGRNSRGFDDF